VARSSAPQHFATTQWSIVLKVGDPGSGVARDALARLCESYWYPLYSYVRRRVENVHEAQDLTQAFFSHLLEHHAIVKADRDRGRFRAFLLTALKNFLANEWDKARAEKRGGGRAVLPLDFEAGESQLAREPVHELTAEKLYERRWVLTMLRQVLETLQSEWTAAGKAAHFELFQEALTGDSSAIDYDRAAAALSITPAAAKQAAYRLRKRYRELFRGEVARTVEHESEVDDEIGRLLKILGE
jgi:RNA polymerase sigma-70 factor (ECF subfamily)